MRTRTVKSGRYLYTPDAPHRFIRCQYCGFICDTTRDSLQPTSGETVTQPDSNIYHKFHAELVADFYTTSCPITVIFSEAVTQPEFHPEPSIDSYTTNYLSTATVFTSYASTPTVFAYFPPVTEMSYNCPFCGGQYTKLPPKY